MRHDAPRVGVREAFLDRRQMPSLNYHEILYRLPDNPRCRTVQRLGNGGHLFFEFRG